jgi:hypothetical protein
MHSARHGSLTAHTYVPYVTYVHNMRMMQTQLDTTFWPDTIMQARKIDIFVNSIPIWHT